MRVSVNVRDAEAVWASCLWTAAFHDRLSRAPPLTVCCRNDSMLSSGRNAGPSGPEEAAMSRKPVHLAVYDPYADWETGHATAYLARAGYEIRTAGPSREPVTSVGGLRGQAAGA